MYHARPPAGAYGTMDAAVMSPRRAEAQAIAGLTRRMIAAEDGGPFARRVEVLHENRRLWRAIAAATADDANDLPDAMRAGLISLAGWVDRATSEVLAGRGAMAPLLDLNRRVVAGLTTRGG